MAVPKFSVVIPVYNRAATILPTLRSVQRQTVQDFECIVVDDGSRDGALLQRAVEELGDKRFRYVRRANGGVCAARNTGIDEATGEYVAFLDSDDEWLPSKLKADERLIAPSRVLFSQVMVVRNGEQIDLRPPRGPRPGEDISEYLACHQGFTQPSTIVLDRDLATRVKFDPALGFLGIDDFDYAVRLSAAGGELRMHPRSCVIMHDNETGDRLSRETDWRLTLEWLDRIKPIMTKRAYLAYRGWHIARQAAQGSDLATGLRYYAAGFTAMPPRLKAKALVQVLLPRRIYKSAQAIAARAAKAIDPRLRTRQ
jgi:glycosyltransferase involved in cell wall biosynthesis